MRLFIATPVPDFVVPGLPADTGAPRHLTLKFLGEVPPDRVGDIGRALERALQGAFAFPVTYAGLGAFPSSRRPRVVWVAISQGAEEIQQLARRVEDALAGLGFPREDRPFHPHVTVRRVRGPRDERWAMDLLSRHGQTTFASAAVDSVLLLESHLHPSGARHEVLFRVQLPPPPH